MNIFFWPKRRKEQKQQLESILHIMYILLHREKPVKHNMDTGMKVHRALRARTDLVQNHSPLLRNNLVTNNGEAKASVGGYVFPIFEDPLTKSHRND